VIDKLLRSSLTTDRAMLIDRLILLEASALSSVDRVQTAIESQY
jgi:hypothetical protein